MDELIVIRPEHPLTNRELLGLALAMGALAWGVPLVADLSLAYVPGLRYIGSGFARAVNDLGGPVLIGLGAALLGVCAPTRAWCFALAIAPVDLFLWIVRAGLAAGQSDVDRIQVLWPALLRIFAITMLPAALTGAITYVVRE